jgi:hypothetical protein
MNRIFQISMKIGIIAIGFVFFILAISSIPIKKPGAFSLSSGYPVPIADPITMTYATEYPAPPTLSVNTAVSPEIKNPPTASVIQTPEIKNTKIVDRTTNPTEKSVLATEYYKKLHLFTPGPTPTRYAFSMMSLNDLPGFIYNAPFFSGSGHEFSGCILTKNPGPAIFVKSLRNLPDYYLLPFFMDHKVCGVALIEMKDGMATFGGWMNDYSEKYPSVSADEAANQVSLKTGKQLSGDPKLVFGYFQEAANPYFPVWQVNTADGQTYFVIFYSAIVEEGYLKTFIDVKNSSEVHILI